MKSIEDVVSELIGVVSKLQDSHLELASVVKEVIERVKIMEENING